jgi:hypothetical protein
MAKREKTNTEEVLAARKGRRHKQELSDGYKAMASEDRETAEENLRISAETLDD